MPGASINCPDRAEFVEFLSGSLEEAQLERLVSHLSECDACGDTVRSLSVNDTLHDLIRQGGDSHEASPPEIGGVLQRLEHLAAADSGLEIVPPERSASDFSNRVHEVECLLEPRQSEREIGRLAHYRVLRLLGAGGMGVVYQAEDKQLQRLVALKILRPSLGIKARERFLQEARLAAAMEHDNVVTIYHVGSHGPLAFLAMQWLDGETLEDRLKRESKIPESDAREIARQVATGLEAAHAKKLIHRDIKPANIWLEADRQRVRILDFGLAQAVDDDDPQLTETGMIAGTPAYMSPEQAQGRPVDERSDLFSLGTMLYRMLTGRLPFDASNALATIRSIQLEDPPAPRQLDLSISSTLSDTVMSLLEKTARDRPESARCVAECLAGKRRPKTVRPKATTIPSKTHGSGWFFVAMLMIALGMGGYAAFPTIYRIVTDSAEITVESSDDRVKVEVLQGGKVIKLIDTITDQSVTLQSGQYELRVRGNDETDSAAQQLYLAAQRSGRSESDSSRKEQTRSATTQRVSTSEYPARGPQRPEKKRTATGVP